MSDLICRRTMQRCQTPGMCLPFRGCPDPMQRTMHDQLAECAAIVREILGPGGGLRCDENLADMLRTLQCVNRAKDAEIADLRRQLEISRCATSSLQQQNQRDSRRICEQAAEIAELREGLVRAEQSWLNWQNRCEFTERERDEARECVRRLCEILREIYVNTPISEELYEKALAATPEHLR